MKNIKVIAIAALFAVAAASMAQVSGRSFKYSAADAMDQDFSAQGDFALKVRTKVTVNPYLYVKGNLGAEWTVDGWGTGTDSKTESIRFYHNETLTLDLEEFNNPQKISGTKTGAQAIDLQAELAFFNDQNKKQVYTSGMVDAKKLNEIFQPSGPNFEVDFTGGLMRLDLSRKISISPNVGPGVYENVGIVKVIRN
jgi:hypothetical protein